ncbi:hypothetical protein FGB62_31g122 [Gracilaria domingensis]|nr:hypothetical protein FGB62_31g122 [Gracilaria domingensis]
MCTASLQYVFESEPSGYTYGQTPLLLTDRAKFKHVPYDRPDIRSRQLGENLKTGELLGAQGAAEDDAFYS